MTFELKSPAFESGQIIPRKYTCVGDDLSPPLSWAAPPLEVEEFALIVDDPDAPRKVWGPVRRRDLPTVIPSGFMP
jgi:phosphatidylethanolamine-binding protein (PEBP) family uncharacterized protein